MRPDMYDNTAAEGGAANWVEVSRHVLGAALILVGIGLAVWLAASIYGLIWSAAVPGVVANLTPQSQEDVALIFPGGEVVLAHKVFPLLAYILTVLLLMVGVALVKATVSGGTALLRGGAVAEAPAAMPADSAVRDRVRDEERETMEAYYHRTPL